MALLQTLQSAITSIPIVEQYFLNPLGLLGLLALIPLAIFYLVKPKPEEQVMPSMRFFHEEDGSSQLRSALRSILRNLVLLLQILAVVGFAVALAEPFLTAMEQPENSVIVFDRSASMEGDLQQARDFVESRLGEENTLIVVDSDIDIEAERAPPSKVRDIIGDIEPVDTETDIASAIDTARSYRGRLVLASDLDQTVDDRSVDQLLTSLSTRPIDTMEQVQSNSWGIKGIDVDRNQTTVEVEYYDEGNATMDVIHGSQVRSVSLREGETASLTFESSLGRNTVELPEDGMSSDNTAYYFIPETEEIQVEYLGPDNRYFRTAVELIPGARISETVSGAADVYALGGELDEEEDLESIASEIEQGAAAVVFQDSRALGEAFGFNTSYRTQNRSVSLNYPQRIDIGRTEVLDRGLTGGEALSNPGNAFSIQSYGEGKILTYNINDESFRTSFLYPVFWEAALARITDQPTVGELNLETSEDLEAETLNTPSGNTYSGEVNLNETGFYTSGDRTYAVNLLSGDESSPDGVEYSSQNDRKLQETERNVQSLATLLLAALIGIEITYLWYRGDL
jgi:hypothetical protein